MSDSSITPEMLELAALYALGALAGPELEELERELELNPELRAEVDAMREAAGWIGATAPPVEPPAELRGRLMAKAFPAKPHVLLAEEGLSILRPSEMRWKPHPLIGGVMVRTLHLNKQTKEVSSLLKIDGGATLSQHRHAGVEELFVLEGRVEINGVEMGPGDYCRAEPGSVHRPSRAITDALILVRSSLADEYDWAAPEVN